MKKEWASSLTFESPVAWDARIPSQERLQKWKRAFLDLKEDFLSALEKDTLRSRFVENVVEWPSVEMAFQWIDEHRELLGPRKISSTVPKVFGLRTLWQRRLPLGQVLVVGTWNYPLTLHGPQILLALACGNRVAFKPSPWTPELAKVFQRWAERAEAPLEVLPEDVPSMLEQIKKGHYQKVIFTGGSQAAQSIASACGVSMTPFVLEASGCEVALFLNAPSSSQLDHLLWASFFNSGQTCVAPRIWLLPSGIASETLQKARTLLDSQVETLKAQPPLRHEGIVKEHQAWVEGLKKRGAQVQNSQIRPDYVFLSGLSVEQLSSSQLEATFGPAVLVLEYADLLEAVEWIKNSPGSLMTSVFGDPTSLSWKKLIELDASIVSWNECIVSAGDMAIPFGGRGRSGVGACYGIEGFLSLTRSQVWVQSRVWPGAELLGVRPSWSSLKNLERLELGLREAKNFVKRKWAHWRGSHENQAEG